MNLLLKSRINSAWNTEFIEAFKALIRENTYDRLWDEKIESSDFQI